MGDLTHGTPCDLSHKVSDYGFFWPTRRDRKAARHTTIAQKVAEIPRFSGTKEATAAPVDHAIGNAKTAFSCGDQLPLLSKTRATAKRMESM